MIRMLIIKKMMPALSLPYGRDVCIHKECQFDSGISWHRYLHSQRSFSATKVPLATLTDATVVLLASAKNHGRVKMWYPPSLDHVILTCSLIGSF